MMRQPSPSGAATAATASSTSGARLRPARRPSGGDGGKGGDVYLAVKPTLNTLIAFNQQRYFKAEDGQPGGSNNRTGRSADDVVIECRRARSCATPTPAP